jgi:anti-sigma factor RsiW
MTDSSDDRQTGRTLAEQFELLSAYVDDEVTTSERYEVEALLESDEAFAHQYRQMLRIQTSLPAMSVPSTSQSPEELALAVFAEIDRPRKRKLSIVGVGAIAAGFLSVVAGLTGLIGGNDRQPQFANGNAPAPIMVALNDPILSIPVKSEGIQVPVSSPEVNAEEVN